MTFYIGQPKSSALMLIGEFFMIDPEKDAKSSPANHAHEPDLLPHYIQNRLFPHR
jgi:hypothetical protein